MDDGAVCLSWWGATMPPQIMQLTEACGGQDKHKAPSLPHIHPLSLQDGADVSKYDPIRLSMIIRMGHPISRFGWQRSSGWQTFSVLALAVAKIHESGSCQHRATHGGRRKRPIPTSTSAPAPTDETAQASHPRIIRNRRRNG